MNYKAILFFLGIYSLLVSVFSILNILYSIYFDFIIDLDSYLITFLISLIIGSSFYYVGQAHSKDITLTDQIIFVVLSFILILLTNSYFSLEESIIYGARDHITKKETKTDDKALELLQQALDNVKPIVEVKSRRVGGATYQVPIEVPNRRQFYLAAHWIIDSAKKRSGSPMSSRLAGELISASNNEGSAIKKKEDTHRMAEANKAFAHFGRGR